MSSYKVYVAGPMRGIKDFNFPAFDEASAYLRRLGATVVNPADHDREMGFEGIGMTGHEPLTDREDFDLKATLKWDLEQVADSDAVAVLEGWENSSGAKAEVALAHALGVPVVPWRQFIYTALDGEDMFQACSRILPDSKPSTNWAKALGEAVWPINKGEVRSVSSSGAEKGVKPERHDLLPVEALGKVARHYGVGAEKYSAHNWRKGYEWSKSYSALQRHATAFWGGEDIDAETGSPHMAAVVFHALALLTFMDEQQKFDDRYRPEKPDLNLKALLGLDQSDFVLAHGKGV